MKKLFNKLFAKKQVIEHTPVQTPDQEFWFGGAFAIGQQVMDHKGRKGTVTNKLGFASKYSHFEYPFPAFHSPLFPPVLRRRRMSRITIPLSRPLHIS